MQALTHQFRHVLSPSMIDLPQKGSIRNLQQNVTLNRFGNKSSTTCSVMNVEDIGVAPNNKDKRSKKTWMGHARI